MTGPTWAEALEAWLASDPVLSKCLFARKRSNLVAFIALAVNRADRHEAAKRLYTAVEDRVHQCGFADETDGELQRLSVKFHNLMLDIEDENGTVQ
ncbi:MAG TPA: hypothetical protein VNX88_12960 [Terriglobales bacterium]|jgi:hypothetical protein|nr:hypothetical protein [Terriglobales bacterium]